MFMIRQRDTDTDGLRLTDEETDYASLGRFRRLEEFSNLDILSDYRLLEEISREKESKRRKARFRNRESRKTRLKENVIVSGWNDGLFVLP